MTIIESGPNPKLFWKENRRKVLAVLNDEGAKLETDLVEATPANTGQLRQGWRFRPAINKPIATVTQINRYFLPLEMGRKPGKGISIEGQKSVQKWATRVLQISSKEANSFAFLLSRKYKLKGKPALGFAGLANPGDPARPATNPIEPVPDGIIGKSFRTIKRRLDQI